MELDAVIIHGRSFDCAATAGQDLHLGFRGGDPIRPLGNAIGRFAGEPADEFAVDAGRLHLADRADTVVINRATLDARLEGCHEASMAGLGDISRRGNRNDAAVEAVLINGRLA